eukprot:TRINITY_DN107903_c0_g1_i1.p2 TRINITY_DN107903_c0_g1~~TRINITY_DN107903_c0_g1_i1.p2  ORF type:complete len:196 (-),score=32.63 TRINITY_DN107903_c0_g1_i1:137-679(-)
MQTEEQVRWQPIQYKLPEVIDLRDSGYGPRGYKVVNEEKLIQQAEIGAQVKSMEVDEAAAAAPVEIQLPKSSSGKKSGRSWKAPANRASAVVVKQNVKTWEEQMKNKRMKKTLLERKRQAIQEFKDRAADKRRALRASRERKEANRKKSTVFERITNSTKLQKLMKNKKMRRKIMSIEID